MGDAESRKTRVGVLLPSSLLRALDELARQIGGDVPICRSALLRTAVEKGLDVIRRSRRIDDRPLAAGANRSGAT